MRFLKQSTQVIVPIGPAVAVGDGFTPVTTLALGTADEAELLKHGSTTVVDISGATFAAITSMDGHYGLTLTTSHTDTCGMLRIAINDDSLILPIVQDYFVLEEAIYDALFGASATGALPVSTGGIAAAAFAAGAIDAAAIANGAIDAATFAADVDAEILSYLVDDATRIDASALNTATGTSIPDILTDTSTTLQGELDGIQADTEDIQAKLGTPSDFGSGTSTIAANLQDIADNGTATFDRSTDSLQAIRDRGDAAWTTGAGGADPFLVASGTIGATGNDTTHLHLDGLTQGDDELNDLLIVITDVSASEVHSRWVSDWVLSTELATVSTLPFTPENSTDTYAILAVRQDVTGGSGPTVGDIADAVWDEATAGHTTSGTFGEQLKTDVDAILVDTDVIGAAGAGLTEAGGDGDHLTAINLPNQTMDIVGNITGNLSGSVGSVTGAVGSVTGNVGGNVAGSVGSVTGAVGSVTGNVGGNVAGSVASVTGNVGGSVASVTGAVGSVTGNVGGNVTGTVGGVAGTITTLDALDTSQDAQHSTTQTAVGTVDTVVDAIKVITDALGATAAARLKLSAETMVTGTVNDANTTPTTTVFAASDITEATADHFNGRIVIFTSGALANQASDITDYALTSGEGVFTVTALTEAPADGVTFIIV